MVRIGINGFGRIGREAFKASFLTEGVEVVAVNDPFIPAKYMAYQLRYDTAHGRWSEEVVGDDEAATLTVGDHVVHTFACRNPADIAWGTHSVDIVLECTGIFKTIEKASAHYHDSVKKVIVSAPSPDAPMFVLGVNHDGVTPDMKVISNASCTTNCLAPVAKVLQDKFGIEEALLTTVHASTATQALVDGPSRKAWRDGRAAPWNIIPATTGAAAAVAKVIPELAGGKFHGMAFRVPTIDVSVVDLTVRLSSDTTIEGIREAMLEASQEGPLAGILGYTDEPVVSSDFMGDRRSSIFDATASMMLNSRFAKIISFYDNEVGYATRIIDLAKFCAENGRL